VKTFELLQSTKYADVQTNSEGLTKDIGAIWPSNRALSEEVKKCGTEQLNPRTRLAVSGGQ